MKLRKGDRVRVLTGKDRGHEGEIIHALPTEGRVIVDGANVVKRHQRPTKGTQEGGIIDKTLPIPVENVAIICTACGPTRVGYRFDERGVKHRICRKCGGDL
ncbi:MAG TPA: 50S ribosomal protein L24 [Acidimicrobiales bacterium]